MITLIKVKMLLISPIQTRLIASIMVFLFSNSCFAEEIIVPPPPIYISLDQATKQIIKNDSNLRVLGAETEAIDGKEVHVIKVLTPDGRILHYKIDAETGEIITNR